MKVLTVKNLWADWIIFGQRGKLKTLKIGRGKLSTGDGFIFTFQKRLIGV
jgi:hypothetical protein